MFYLLKYFEDAFGPLRLFGFVSTRVVCAAFTAFVLMMIVLPPLIRWLKRKKFGEQGSKGEAAVVDAMRDSKKGTPTMGGLGIVGVVMATAILWCNPMEPRTWLLVVGLAAYAGIGYLDDRLKIFKGAKGISSKSKFAIQVLIGTACGFALFAINERNREVLEHKKVDQIGSILVFEHKPPTENVGTKGETFRVPLGTHELAFPFLPLSAAVNLGIFAVLWTLLMTAACANGVNFTDGMDGLASGTMLISALAFMAIAYVTSRVDTTEFLKVLYVPGGQEVAVFSAAVAGACLGFLWFNCAPAEVFMGDTGSQALGGYLALAALNTKQEFLVLLVGFVFFVEALSVILQVGSYKLRNKKRIFLCAPLHHHFQYQGWPESKIVMRFWIIAALAALLALTTLKLR